MAGYGWKIFILSPSDSTMMNKMDLELEEIEKRLLGLDHEIHELLRYIFASKKLDVEAELKNYGDLKKIISRNLKEPLDPTVEIRGMRERRYLV